MIKPKRKRGVTLIELMMVIGIVAVVMLGVAILMADGIKHWGTMYNRLHSEDADNAYAVRAMFDRAIRRSIKTRPPIISTDGYSAQVYYYSYDGIGPTAYPDRRVDFVWDGTNKLTITYRPVDTDGTPTGTDDKLTTINNVTNCKFQPIPLPVSPGNGRSIQMLLTIENKNKPANTSQSYSEILNACSSAYLHID